MKQLVVLKKVEVLKALLSSWRSKILQLLIVQEYTVQQLTKMLIEMTGEKINPGTVYHHIKVLQEAGLVEETRQEIEKNIVMKFYRAVARDFRVDFSVLTGKDETHRDVTQWLESRVTGLIDTLKAYNINIDPKSYIEASEHIKEFINLENKLKEEISPKNPEILKNKDPSIIKDAFSLMTLYLLNQNEEYVMLREKLLDFLKMHENA